MKYTFESGFAHDIETYIKLRASLGNQEETFSRRLYAFDRYCIDQFPEALTLTQEICEGWCSLQKDESLTTLRLRTGILRGFSKYLSSLKKDTYVIPDGYTGTPKMYYPYLYTDEELSVFFEAADTMPPHKLSPCREYVIPVLFRMLYCCGLRPQEIPPLTVEDVDLDSGIIKIYDSKRHKDRIVPMSYELLDLCVEYNRKISVLIPGRQYFFQCKPGRKCTIQWIQVQFHRCWKRCGKQFKKDHHPRVYDFRHNYATHVIRRWMNDGLDVMSMLPYLSSYMGHSSLEYTAYYIHLVPDHLSQNGMTEWETGIEVTHYEK
ncbi:MAG: tyrosine-type recombinase/integrase [Lachnospiraceae bacterium]|nr:tyrosine-type recombinase/integrase [Lachnospiraceae bacterium]